MNIKDFLTQNEIPFRQSGKNVTRGWIEVNCPFCDDHSFHCGISPTLNINCWRCGKHSLTKFFKETFRLSWKQAKDLSKEFKEQDEDIQISYAEKVILPTVYKDFPKRYIDYLKERNFNPYRLIEKYKLKATTNIGRYKFRILIPYYLNRKMVTFNARDISGTSKEKYRKAGSKESIITANRTLFNIDSVKKFSTVYIVEGPFDVFRIGDESVALSGLIITKEQISLLLSKQPVKVVLLAEDGAVDQFRKIAEQLSGMVSTEIIELKDCDPAELTEEEVKEIKREN